jgi:hypothetical protein
VLRFGPYRETDEFVNVGVVVSCPAAGYLNHRIEAKRVARISHFFPEMNIAVYRDSVRSFTGTIAQFSASQKEGHQSLEAEKARIQSSFKELVRPRETILYFSETRVMSAKSPSEALDDLFADYVDRRFAHATEYRETVMKRNLESLLKTHSLLDKYIKDAQVGTDIFKVRLPFVYFDSSFAPSGQVGARPLAAIKPIDLNKSDATDVISHADAWKSKIYRLREFGSAPGKVMFTIGDAPTDSAARIAYDRVIGEFQAMDIDVASENDSNAVLRFAHSA